MSDTIHKVTKYISYNRGTVIGVLLAVLCMGAMCLFTFGCESRVASLDKPDAKVTRAEFRAEEVQAIAGFERRRAVLVADADVLTGEVEAHNVLVEAGYNSLTRQDELKANLLNLGVSTAVEVAGGTFNPVSLIGGALGIFGLSVAAGKTYDNKRKDAKIAELKASETSG